MIPGISENGDSVYFVANGVLAPGAKPGDCIHIAQETPAARRDLQPLSLAQRDDQLHRASCPTKTRATGAASKARAKKARTSSRGPISPTSPPASPRTANTSRSCPRQPLTGYDNADANQPRACATRRSTCTRPAPACWPACRATPTARPSACTTRRCPAKASGWS